MATQTDFVFNRTTSAQVYQYRLVRQALGLVLLNSATATHIPVGVVQGMDVTGAPGETVSIRDFKHGGTHKVVAAGAIGIGAAIYAAANGKVQALPAGAGTYRFLGYAFEAAAADDSIFEAWLFAGGGTETVTGS